MEPWWLSFADGTQGCVEAATQLEAEAIGKELKKQDVRTCHRLPYPAMPRLNMYKGPYGSCPSFCMTPHTCKGRTACPKSYSCSE